MAMDDIAFQRYMESFPAGSIIPMTAQELDQARARAQLQGPGPLGGFPGTGLGAIVGAGNPFGPYPTLDPAARQGMSGGLATIRGVPPVVKRRRNWEPWLIGLEALAYLAGGLLWAWFCTVV